MAGWGEPVPDKAIESPSARSFGVGEHPSVAARIVVYSLSHVQLFGDPLNCSQAPLSMGFPRQEYWNRLPFSSPRDLPDPGMGPASPALAGRFFTTEPPQKLPNKN